MRDQLTVISNNRNNLTNLTEVLQDGLNETKANLTRIQNDCNAIDPRPRFCNDTDIDSLDTEANFTNLPDVSEQLSNIEEVISNDFEKSANDVSVNQKLSYFSSRYTYLS